MEVATILECTDATKGKSIAKDTDTIIIEVTGGILILWPKEPA